MQQEVNVFQQEYATLNPEQHRAVHHKNGPLLILAGAGSGKTKVVSLRIAYLIDQGVPPDAILGLTFTNKAAKEMRDRVANIVGKNVLISTFHSLGVQILRQTIHYLGYSNQFVIYDEEDSEKLLKNIIKEQFGSKSPFDAKSAKALFSHAKNNLAMADFGDHGPIYKLYSEHLKNCNAVDFDDLLFLPVTIFRQFPEILQRFQQRWHYLLVDEYQDTNIAQYELIRLLVEKSKNLFVVGDPDQSIYSWRGANINNILNFERDYAGASLIRLEHNYRSTETILQAANAVIQNNCKRYEKKLISTHGKGNKIGIFQAFSERQEAEFVAQTISNLQSEKNLRLNDTVVFYRTNFQSRALEDELIYRKIPYTIVGGLSFYQRKEIKDILAYLRLLEHPTDVLAFTRIINLPKRGFGDVFIAKVVQCARETATPIVYLLDGPAPFPMTAKQKENWDELAKIFQYLREEKSKVTVAQLVRTTIQATKYLSVLDADEETRDERKENVAELIAKAAEWQGTKEKPSLTNFLEEIALATSTDVMTNDGDRLSLMTVHNGKGLEFNTVFIVGLEEDLFPHINSKRGHDDVEEERRLFYVGMTRAKETLFISHVRQRQLWGTTRFMVQSRFLYEIPKSLQFKPAFARV